MKAKIVIIGAGVTGLSAACELMRRGDEDFILLEGASRPGGVIQTLDDAPAESVDAEGADEIAGRGTGFLPGPVRCQLNNTGHVFATSAGHWNGEARKVAPPPADKFLLELGPDAFLADDPRAGHILPELELQSEVPPDKEGSTTYIWKQGRALRLPRGWLRMAPESFTETLTTRLLSWPVKARMVREFLLGARPGEQFKGDMADESVGEFLAHRFGQEFTGQVAEPILGALFHLRPEEASLRALFPKLWEYAGSKSLSRALWREMRSRTRRSLGRVGIQGGMARLTEALAARLRPGQLRCDLRVESISPHKDGFRLRTSRGDGECERLILAVPAWSAAPMIENFDPELAGALCRIEYAPACLVHLGFEKAPRLTPGHALFVPAAAQTATRAITFVHRKYPGRAPAGAALLRLALDAGKLSGWNDDQVIRLARNELGTIFGLTAEPCLSHVQRWPRAAPLLRTGHLERAREVLLRAQKYPNFVLASNAVHGASVAACLEAGRRAAKV